MNKLLSITLLLVWFAQATLLYSQGNDKFKKYENNTAFSPGSIIDNCGNKITGLIKDINEYRRYYEVVFVSKEGLRKRYSSWDIKAYEDQSGKYISIGENFLKVVKEGESVSLFELVVLRSSGTGALAPITFSFLKKSDEEEFQSIPAPFGFTSFTKEIGAYFSDCENLKQKIEDKEFKRKNLKEIVDYYNNECRSYNALGQKK